VEGTHGELRTRLANRLGGNDADRLTGIDRRTATEVTAITLGAQTVAGFTGQRRADLDFINSQLSIRSTVSSSSSVPASMRVSCVSGSTTSFAGHTAKNALAQRLDDLTAFDQRLHGNAVGWCRNRPR
jgi:hypothetical protein